MIDTFDQLFMKEAYLYASKSKDISTQVGAVIVNDNHSVSRGYNGPLRGANDKDPLIFEHPYKSFAMEHAERNAFYNCARHGKSTLGCTMYVTWAPCAECARAIVQCGIKKLILHADAPQHTNPAIAETQSYGNKFMIEAGIEISLWSGPLNNIDILRFNRQDWKWNNTNLKWEII